VADGSLAQSAADGSHPGVLDDGDAAFAQRVHERLHQVDGIELCLLGEGDRAGHRERQVGRIVPAHVEARSGRGLELVSQRRRALGRRRVRVCSLDLHGHSEAAAEIQQPPSTVAVRVDVRAHHVPRIPGGDL